ncbi:MAG: TetR/AcrR family transcriptional regulator [Muribaculaceae bacterium]|nr:TetR/AcrR family transcriptional regulator [Muribaculaceae bacterium]
MVSRTREKLIEVARQLFANKGVENTTMSDIASASDKGRRTIYTYFKNKWEIYEATIENDSELMVKQLRKEVSLESTPEGKLRRFLRYRLNLFEIPDTQVRNVRLDSILHLDFNRIDKVRVLALNKEKELLKDILDQGVKDGSFNSIQAKHFIPVLQFLLRGVDMTQYHDKHHELDIDKTEYKDLIINYIIKSLTLKS